MAGCQVFHVCHDVLVSSFLCPIGSIFSQKLLTCDWWTKVDCSSSGKYVDVNRNSYQQDDDEMIRNAYAMISLRSGTDVTKDGLVDPDRTGSIVDYQKGRVSDYSSPLDPPTGNDLRTKFEDRRRPPPSARDFLPPPYRLKEIGRPADRHQEKFHHVQEGTKPYEDSPVIRVQKIGDPGYDDEERRRKVLQEATHRRGGGNDGHFVNQFQPSYAPTVPTVTTTTRRFYSPTVPTTFRPSTLAYNSLDQAIDSSDYYLSKGSRGDGFVTPPTSAAVGAEGRRVPSRKAGAREEDYEYPGRQGSYEYDYEEEEEGGSRFRVRVLDPGTRNGTLGEAFDSKVYFGFEDDFETRGSIGLGQALRQSFRGISVQRQNPARDETAKGASLRLPGKGGDTGHGSAKGETSERQRSATNDERGSNDSTATEAPSVIESAVKPTTTTTVASHPESNASSTASSVAEFSRDTTIEALPPRGRFQIKVPDDSSTSAASSSTLDEFYPSTTESESSFARNYSEEKERATTVNNEGISDYHPTTVAEPNSDEIPSFDRSKEDTSTPSLIMNDAEGGAKNATSSNATLDPLGKIHWKSLVDGNNKDSPYQVTLTMNGREQLVPVDARMGEEGERELEIIESVEPPRSTTVSNDLEGGERRGAISLRRLMSELFKLDRVPRPFSSPSSFPSNEQGPRLEQEREESDAELRARTRILYDVLTTRRAEQASAGEVGESWRGEEILDRLAENFGGEPFYKGGKKGGPVFELPGEERAVDFHDGGTMEEGEEEVSTPSSSTSTEAKTVVKTEFVPSLGFSLDTDEGREEYVEAVLGGLIEPRAAGSEKGEAILGGSFERKNETLEGKM